VLKGINFHNSKKNYNIEKVQYEIARTLINKWKIFKKTPTRMDFFVMKHEKPTLWHDMKRTHKVGREKVLEKRFNLNSCIRYDVSNVY